MSEIINTTVQNEPRCQLQIDWCEEGTELRVGAALLPRFTLKCEGLKTRPMVRIELDHRLVTPEGGLEVTRLQYDNHSREWSFHVPLTIKPKSDEPIQNADYMLTLYADFLEDNGATWYCFQSCIRFSVNNGVNNNTIINNITVGDHGLVVVDNEGHDGIIIPSKVAIEPR